MSPSGQHVRPRAFHEAGLAGSEANSAQGQMRQGQVAPVLSNYSLHSVGEVESE